MPEHKGLPIDGCHTSPPLEEASFNGTYSQSFAPNCLRGEQIGALFNSHSFCTVVVDVESLEDLSGRKKRAIMLCHRFWVFPGALQRRIHVNLSWSPQEQRTFEETFTD